MDDEDLAQDVLDQFDLVCTQYSATSEVNSNCYAKNRDRFKASGRIGGFKLSKTSSLDANTSRCPEFDLRHQQQKEDELQHLKDEIISLKEELYLKVGEISSLKEASSRNAAANMETVRKLKMQLASEREEARKTMAALGSQLAFREADYQLVVSELAQAKEAVASQSVASAAANDASTTAAAGILAITDVSPASALLMSMASQSPLDCRTSIGGDHTSAEPASHNLPVVVTPVPSRRSRRQAVWKNDLGNTPQQYRVPERASHAPHVMLLNQNNNKFSPEVKPGFHGTIRDLDSPSEKTMAGVAGAREGGPQRTPCKRPRTDTSPPTHPNRTPIVSSLTPPFQPRHGLRHRCNLEAFIRSRGGGGDNGASFNNRKQKLPPSFSARLVRDFAHLASLAPPLPLPEHDPSQRCLIRLIEDNISAFASPPEVEFFHGLSILSQLPQSVGARSPSSANQLSSLCQALTHLLRLIRNRLNRYFDFFFRYRTQQGGLGCLSSSSSVSALRQDLSTSRAGEKTSIPNATGSNPIELTEDPFAGAPASQAVPIPSSTPSNQQQSATSTVYALLDGSFLSTTDRAFPASDWLTFCASLSTSGAFACLQQLLLLIQAFPTSWVNEQRSATALREVASLVGWAINAVAHLFTGLSNKQPDGRSPLRDLRPDWTRELTMIAEFSLNLACLLSPELTSEVDLAVCNASGPSTLQNLYWWPPSLPAVLIIADQVMRIEGGDGKKLEAPAEGSRQRCQQQKPSRFSPHVLAPLLRLLARLVESSQLPAFGHDWFNDANPTPVSPSWWCSGYPESALPATLDSSKCAIETGGPIAELLLNDLLSRMQLLRVAGMRQPERIIALENCILRQLISSSQSMRESSLQHQLGCPLSLLCKLVLAQWKQRLLDPSPSSPRQRLSDNEVAFSGPVRKCCILLTEFSSLITALLVKHQLPASSSCTCTVEVYSTLISLGVSPTKWLFRLSQSPAGQRLTATCLAALGQLMQTLQALLLAHGDDAFQSFTDRVPAFFCVISDLSRWCRYSSPHPMEGNTSVATSAACLLHPKLVEELNDFDSSLSEVHTVSAQPHVTTCH